MLNIPAEIQDVIKNDATLKNFRVHFPNGERADITNENIVFESVGFTESICSSNIFKFGLAEASVIEFETVGVENIIGKMIECSMEFAVPADLQQTYGEWYSIPYGTFIVDRCPRNHENMTHRRVIGYSLLKTMLASQNFLQDRVLPIPTIHVSFASLIAYITGDTSEFQETSLTPQTSISRRIVYLYDSSGNEYQITPQNTVTQDEAVGVYYTPSGLYSGYILNYEQTGDVSNEEVGKAIVNYLDSRGAELFYDENGSKIYNSNEEALRSRGGYFFSPHAYIQEFTSNENAFFLGSKIEVGRFMPLYNDKMLPSSSKDDFVNCLLNVSNVHISKTVNNVISSYGDVAISNYTASSSCSAYSGSRSALNAIAIQNTLVINRAFMYYRPFSDKKKAFYGKMYAYSNAYSSKDFINDFAGLSCSFVHSERDGSISMETLNNENPYQIMLSDIEGSAWWDEYNVNPIGTVKYTFTNPDTGQIANGEYVFNDEAKSIYDLSGNTIIESMDFSVIKADTVSKMTDANKIYLYIGNESGYTKGDFYYYGSNGWASGGHYESAKSIANFILQRLFVPNVNKVNFTPVEMNLRALPYLEAGDAITLTTADGAVLNSYILNHSIEGVQHLTQSIESVSGEVIE